MLEGKVALVTGGSRGIGSAIALSMARRGAKVAVFHARPGSADETVRQLSGAGADPLALQVDVASREQVDQGVEKVVAKYGGLDILVNNAGVTRDGLLVRMSDDDWDRVVRTNLAGTFYCTRAAVRPMMKRRWGRVINLSSVIGLHGNGGQANYAASKAGIVGFTKSAAKELASRGITVNAIAPGYIVTEMTEAISPEAKEKLTGMVPMARLGTPQDVAEAACFLAGDAAAYVTGTVIQVDGGLFI